MADYTNRHRRSIYFVGYVVDYGGVEMKIPKKLEEKREALILEKQSPYNEAYRPIVGAMIHTGFDAACDLLLPEIEKLKRALDHIQISNVPSDHDWIIAYDSLQSLEEFLGDKSEGGDE